MRRVLPVLGALGIITAFATAAGSAAAPVTALTRQQLAEKLLDSPAFLSSNARAALEVIARNDHRIALDSTGIKLKGVPLKGARLAGGPGLVNVRVNDPGEDSRQLDQTTQSETSVAVAGANVVVGFNDSQTTGVFFTAGTNLSGVAHSSNGGQSFTDDGAPPQTLGFMNFGDPWVVADSAGNFYYSTLAFDVTRFTLRVAVDRSGDGGKTWTAGPPIVPPPGPDVDFYTADKDALTVAGTTLYDTWDDFTANLTDTSLMTGLPLVRSTDGGQTWSPAVYASRISAFPDQNSSPPGCSFQQYIGAQPIVANGALYLAAEKLEVNDPSCVGAPLQYQEMIMKSTDGGATWGSPVAINAPSTPSTGSSSAEATGAFELGPTQLMRNEEFPSIATRNGNLYVTWNDGSSGNSHIMLGSSSDGGATWSVSAVTNGPNNEAQPSISADAGGLHVVYYEIAPDANGNNLVDVYVSNSGNGANWKATRVTSQSFPGVPTYPQFDPLEAHAYMGDYISNVSDGHHQYFAWGDNRDIVTDLLWPSGRHDPDVFFAMQ